jgi:hypothetical protein
MLCNDFARLGYDYVVVDAGVQLTYDWNLAREMMACKLRILGGLWRWCHTRARAGGGVLPECRLDIDAS